MSPLENLKYDISFFHSCDITHNSDETYIFSHDDVFDHSVTIHAISPEKIPFTIGGFSKVKTVRSDKMRRRQIKLFSFCTYIHYVFWGELCVQEGGKNIPKINILLENHISKCYLQME